MKSISQIAGLLRNGKSVRQSAEAGGVPISRIETIADGTVDPLRVGFAGLKESDCADWILQDGDILISHINSTKHLGKCAIYEGNPPVLVHGMNLLALRVDAALAAPRYVYRMLSSLEFRRQLPRITKNSVNQSSFNISNFKKLQIPLPPLPEQKRIATSLDAADALRTQRREALAQLDILLQSVFLDMFGRDRPPVSIGEPSFGDASGFVLLSSVARLATGHTPDRKKPEYWDGDIPWISLTDIRDLDGRVAYETGRNVTSEGIQNSSSVVLPEGTVCFSRTASVGFVTVMGREMATSQDFVNWVCGERIHPVYLMWALRHSRPYLLSKSSGSTHKTIYYRHAEQIHVLLPSRDLQNRFSEIVASVGAQRSQHRAHLAELDTLFASLQSRAFRGEL